MEIAQKIAEYEQEIKRLQLKIELLKECQGEPQKPIAELFNAVPAQVAPKPKEVEKVPENVISRTQKGKVVTEEIYIGGSGTAPAKDYYGK